jgi:hypothetical protein
VQKSRVGAENFGEPIEKNVILVYDIRRMIFDGRYYDPKEI